MPEPRKGLLGPLACYQIRTEVPLTGPLLSGTHEYRYPQESIASFHEPEVFADLMHESGLKVRQVTPVTFGVCCLYVACLR